MLFKSESRYELQFINDSHFEIYCSDCNDTWGVKRQLEKVEFVKDIALVEVLDGKYLEKITGISTSQQDLMSCLDEWFDLLNSKEINIYKDIG
ncbi:hypothetical protein I6M70_03215 [Acinetobacter pittii]|uniref:hypothetical protein n=1 Tax=Acinetobacter pittii TaxID=48296 RepID=UPI00190284F9|nr:hypothetical protein [Acinetobacter pittii]MBJ8478378.1 hypothetical protein [Acinetobacter pittii]